MDINPLDFINIDLGQEDDTIVFMAIAIVVALLLVLTFLLGEVFEFFDDAGTPLNEADDRTTHRRNAHVDSGGLLVRHHHNDAEMPYT